MKIYCLPGLGTDERIFEQFDPGPFAVEKLRWPMMRPGSALNDYAIELSASVDISQPHVLLGVSMGGMVAMEMAGLTHPQKVIVISSWKHPSERPGYLTWLGRAGAERLVGKFFMERFVPTMRAMYWALGLEDRSTQRHISEMMSAWHPAQLRIMMHACATWRGTDAQRVVHIHGDRDVLMPVRLIRDPLVVRGGSHAMIHTKAAEVNDLVRSALSAP